MMIACSPMFVTRLLSNTLTFLLAGLLANLVIAESVTDDNNGLTDGEKILDAACTQCHGLKPVQNLVDGQGGWRETVEEMVLRGAQLLPGEDEKLIRYLSFRYGMGQSAMITGALPPHSIIDNHEVTLSKAIVLPSGNGLDLVVTRCTICHDLGRLVSKQRSEEEWRLVTENMVKRGTPISKNEFQAIVSYLSNHYGTQATNLR